MSVGLGIFGTSQDSAGNSKNGWIDALVLVGIFTLFGGFLGGLARPLFLLGCLAVAISALRRGIYAHFQATLLLYTFTPFLRRMVDYGAGYESMGLMLVGPLLALLVPVFDLRRLFDGREPLDERLGPLALAGVCVLYTGMVTLIAGQFNDMASGLLKCMAPILYAAVLVYRADRDELLDAAVRAFYIILPVTAIYGILQFMQPQPWDVYWMQMAPIPSIGYPLPYEVRVFSVLNAPAAFATYTAVGLLLVTFLRTGWVSLLVMAPSSLALLLSLYRTAWVSLAVALLFCLLFARTRLKSQLVIIALIAAGFGALTIPPFSDVIGVRFASISNGSKDGSLIERFEQYETMWLLPDSSLFGKGFGGADVLTAGTTAVDGMIITCWQMMGIVAGLLCLCSLGWAIALAVYRSLRERSREAVMIGAVAMFNLAQIPFANILFSEAGFLFWTYVVLLPTAFHPRSRIP